MRILHLTPGTGNFHCGSCLRDHALIKALRSRGHDAIMAPLYLPLVTDREVANPEIGIRVGGISLFLQQKMPWFRFLPRFIHRWLDKPNHLRFASRFMGMTSARDLGEMTLGALEGESGRQWPEWQRLIEWIRTEGKPDVISLSNSLLIGLCPTLERDLGIPVVVSLQGEDSFLDTLIEPYREKSWAAMRSNAQHVSKFVAPSQFYARVMQEKLAVGADKMAVVFNGLDANSFSVADPDPNWPVIGYFARMIHGKGLTTLVDAYIQLSKRGTVPRVKLKIGGAKTASDDKYIASLQKKLKDAGCAQRVEWHPNLSFADKLKFFRNLTVLSVPATYGEAFGLYILEAMASGVPVVQPDHGAFPELIAASGGGVLCPPDDVTALADALEKLLLDDYQREQISNRGLTGVRTEFSAARMAERFDAVLTEAKQSITPKV
ncbi:glycosyltransferase involved in cell wall biosynthesis [Prosthecobacter fusiformis]|uniref:Glycosyltransferase involved in cell wall biosynthesis n=1 Tax=Prosthecobacter fusiformis TaxID=48464 RepID=A0A4R7RKB7_9BACT|nr:glycosyltransferase family 4 protein [Prosthecobacter fusiformis]TDU64055.1 glycosyltransferase involved in cell wall biosynthesis [Prosthecobacter fusiformis]